MKNLFPFLFLFLLLVSCGGDDDICTSGEGTPRLKVRFKDTNNKLKTLDSIYVDMDYGSGFKNISTQARVDSLLIPLRVDDTTFTDIQISNRKGGQASKLRISYTTKSEYVSPACGLKKLYENVESALISTGPILNLEQTQKQILDENKTHIFLIF